MNNRVEKSKFDAVNMEPVAEFLLILVGRGLHVVEQIEQAGCLSGWCSHGLRLVGRLFTAYLFGLFFRLLVEIDDEIHKELL